MAASPGGANENNDSAKSITLNVSRDVILESGSAITAENRTSGGDGGDITIVAGRNVELHNNGGLAPGATISSSKTGGGGGGTTAHRDHYEKMIQLLVDKGAPLDGIGMFGCTLYAAPGSALLASVGMPTDANGAAGLTMPLPDLPLFQGDFVVQWVYQSPGANPLGLQVSRGSFVQVR